MKTDTKRIPRRASKLKLRHKNDKTDSYPIRVSEAVLAIIVERKHYENERPDAVLRRTFKLPQKNLKKA